MEESETRIGEEDKEVGTTMGWEVSRDWLMWKVNSRRARNWDGRGEDTGSTTGGSCAGDVEAVLDLEENGEGFKGVGTAEGLVVAVVEGR